MADSSVTTTFFANDKDAQAALVRLEKKYADLEAKIKGVGKASRQSNEEGKAGMDDWATGISSVAMGYLALPAILARVTDAQEKLNLKADEGELKYDRMMRKIRVQAGLTALQTDDAKKRITQIALKTGVSDIEIAGGAAEELVSQGFSPAEGTGSALESVLKTMKASNLGSDPKAIAQAIAQFLEASGMEKTTANADKALIAVQRLFKGTPLQLSNLTDLASRTAQFRGKLSMQENLAAFTMLREIESPERAATDLARFVTRLSTSAATPEKIQALQKMGMKPDDVDFVGERLPEVLERLSGGVGKLDRKDVAPTLHKLFGEEGIAGATALIEGRRKLPGFIGMMEDRAAFEADFAVAAGGKAAGRDRLKIAEEFAISKTDRGIEDILAAGRMVRTARGERGALTDLEEWFARKVDAVPLVGPMVAAARERDMANADPNSLMGQVRDVLKASTEASDRLEKILERIEENTRARVRREAVGAR